MLGAGFGAAVHASAFPSEGAGGCGSAVRAPAFLSEGWEVAALWGRSPERAREAAQGLGIAAWDQGWRSLVERDDIDAVAIATPPAPHREMVLAAVAAGKHVLCEKPFALDGAEAAEMAGGGARGPTAAPR